MADVRNAALTTLSSTQRLPDTARLQPLTTKFVYASTCTSHWLQLYPNDSSWYDRLYSGTEANSYFESCQPSGAVGYPRYSPGYCPSGHSIARITESWIWPPPGDGSGRLWMGACCPSGFTYSVDQTQYFCTSSMSSSVVAYRRFLTTYTTIVSGSETTTSSWNYDVKLNSTTVYYASLYVDPVEVMWKASDLPKFEPSYAAALASKLNISFTTTAVAGTTSTQTAIPSQTTGIRGPTSPPVPSSGLSTGAKAGIGVGAALGGLVLAAAVLFLIFIRRKRRTTHTTAEPTYNPTAAEAPELVQYYNPVRQSDAMSGTTYADNQIPKSPVPMSPRQ